MTPEQIKRASMLLERRTSLNEQIAKLASELPRLRSRGDDDYRRVSVVLGVTEHGRRVDGAGEVTVTLRPEDLLELLRTYLKAVETKLVDAGVNLGDWQEV